jgi:TonB family protein
VVRHASWALEQYQPTRIPTQIPITVEEPPAGIAIPGAIPGQAGGNADGIVGGLMRELTAAVAPLPHPVAVPKPAPIPPAAPPIQRFTVGGDVRLGDPLARPTPQYPPLARATRTTGDVRLECVVGINGRVQEVKVLSGNPLLTRAAEEAAWKWVYAPSKLNGVPIEIVTVLTFSFKLN